MAPSLALLLRKLQFWGADLGGFDADAIERYRARVQTVAKLAHERGEAEVSALLSALDRQLALASERGHSGGSDIDARYVQRAIAALL